MADIVSTEMRSRMMASIRRRDTKPELVVRKALHAAGFRFRLDVRSMPGSPDIVLPKWGAAIFVHGCFWHRHAECAYSSTPSTRPEFWRAKFEANVARDQRNESALVESGWKVAVVWECGLSSAFQQNTLVDLVSFIRSEDRALTKGHFPTKPPRLSS